MKRRGFLALFAACARAPFVSRPAKHAVSNVGAPSAQAKTVWVNESWGLLRDVSELTDDGVTGTWGSVRGIPGRHPVGSDVFGSPRRFSFGGKNVG